jgi:hypothetical protein
MYVRYPSSDVASLIRAASLFRIFAKAGDFGGARSLRDQPQTDDTGEDEADAYQPQRRRRLGE